MALPRTTFIIATYRRADALRCTLESLRLQQLPDWEAVVVGDCCGPETAAVIRPLADRRIRYYNLPRRCGEQAMPNTLGLQLATGDVVSFLNHDDLLLADHLTYGLDVLSTQGADLFFGLAANITDVQVNAHGHPIPSCTGFVPRYRDLSLLIARGNCLFDPSSFWLVRTDFARHVGSWRPALSVWRTPLNDWLLRAWRHGGRVAWGDQVTGLRVWTHNLCRGGGPAYAQGAPENEHLLRRLQSTPPETLRCELLDEWQRYCRATGQICLPAGRRTPPSGFVGLSRLRRWIGSFLFLHLGCDPVSALARLRGQPRGYLLNAAVKHRLAIALPDLPNPRELLRNPEAYRVL
jgi:hypothetical protein